MSNDKQELGRLKLGLSYYERNHWTEWFDSASKRARAKRGSKRGKVKDNRTVKAVVEQVGLDGELLVSPIQVNANTHLWSELPSEWKGS